MGTQNFEFAVATEEDVFRYGGAKRWFPKSCQAFQNDFHPQLSYNDLGYWEFLSFIAWHKKNLLVWASITFLEKGIPRLKSGSFKRCGETLRRNKCLYRWQSRPKAGNIWLINPELIYERDRENLKNLPLWQRLIKSDRNDLKKNPDHFDPTFGSKRSVRRAPSCVSSDQKDPQVLHLQSFTGPPNTAQCVIAPSQSSGGADRDPSEGEERCPSGQDHTASEKGVGLEADSIRPYQQQLSELRKARKRGIISDEIFNREVERLSALQSTTEPTESELPVGSGAKSNSRAQLEI